MTAPSIGAWYADINKSWFNPPNWIFAPMWITLFTLMGISLYIVWMKRGRLLKVPKIFWLQLVLNTLWSILFFGLKMPGLAFLEIGLLWAAIALTTVRFYDVSRNAGLILIPYLLWVSFAAILNLFIWLLN